MFISMHMHLIVEITLTDDSVNLQIFFHYYGIINE